MTLCFCSHRSVSHEMNGVCTIRGCRCCSYTAIVAGQGLLRRNPLQLVAADVAARKRSAGVQLALERFS